MRTRCSSSYPYRSRTRPRLTRARIVARLTWPRPASRTRSCWSWAGVSLMPPSLRGASAWPCGDQRRSLARLEVLGVPEGEGEGHAFVVELVVGLEEAHAAVLRERHRPGRLALPVPGDELALLSGREGKSAHGLLPMPTWAIWPRSRHFRPALQAGQPNTPITSPG